MLDLLKQLKEKQLINYSTFYFAQLIAKHTPDTISKDRRDLIILLSAMVQYEVLQGHSALDLNKSDLHNYFNLLPTQSELQKQIADKIAHFDLKDLENLLGEHPAFSTDPNIPTPLLKQNNLLYFYRYYTAETEIAQFIQNCLQETPKTIDITQVNALFDANSESEDQKNAVLTALKNKFCLITGGPGTGKTFTIQKILEALDKDLKIAITAPTGKATARIKESLQNLQIKNFKISTLQKLIGSRTFDYKPKFNENNKLDLDVLIIDEASMLDLFLLNHTIKALPEKCKLILLGDKNQLASVEAGSVMADLASLNNSSKKQTIENCICMLTQNRRSNNHPEIGELANLVKQQNTTKAWQLLEKAKNDLKLIIYHKKQQFKEIKDWQKLCNAQILDLVKNGYKEYCELLKQPCNDENIAKIFEAFNSFRILSALNISNFGAEYINFIAVNYLKEIGALKFTNYQNNFHGKPILIKQNLSDLGLLNGDIGIMLNDENNKLHIYFKTPEKLIKITPLNLQTDNYELAFCMTVHKSQGSEFQTCALVLPYEEHQILSTELVYTAITRSKAKFILLGAEKSFKQAVNSRTKRHSGLINQIKALGED